MLSFFNYSHMSTSDHQSEFQIDLNSDSHFKVSFLSPKLVTNNNWDGEEIKEIEPPWDDRPTLQETWINTSIDDPAC